MGVSISILPPWEMKGKDLPQELAGMGGVCFVWCLWFPWSNSCSQARLATSAWSAHHAGVTFPPCPAVLGTSMPRDTALYFLYLEKGKAYVGT